MQSALTISSPYESDVLGSNNALAQHLTRVWIAPSAALLEPIMGSSTDVSGVHCAHRMCRAALCAYWTRAILDNVAFTWPEVVGRRVTQLSVRVDKAVWSYPRPVEHCTRWTPTVCPSCRPRAT